MNNENNKVTTLSSIILIVLKELRLERNIHQAHLAEKCGKTPSAWNKIESGKSPLTMELFLKVCNTIPVAPSTVLATAENYSNLFAQQGWAILAQQLDVKEDILLQRMQDYYISLEYKTRVPQVAWNLNVSILNTPYYDLNGSLIVNIAFRYILENNQG